MPQRGQTELSSPEFIYNSAEANIMHLSSASPTGGGTPGYVPKNRGLCGDFAAYFGCFSLGNMGPLI